MILDLSVFKEETLDIKMMDGQVLHVRKPSQRMVIEILKLRDLDEHSAPEEIIGAVNKMVWTILNDNTEDVHFAPYVVENMSLEIKQAILNGYTEFTTKLQQNPT